MLKKIVRDVIILFCFAVLWLSTSRSAMAYLSDHRRVNAWWGKYDWLNGNLAGMSYLDFVNKFRTAEDYSRKSQTYNIPKNTALFLHGDSHTRHPQLRDTDFAGVSEYHFINEYSKYYFHAAPAERNILIIEIAENHVREYFSDLKIFDDICDTAHKKDQAGISPIQQPAIKYSSIVSGINPDWFFNKYINQNIEFNLVNYNFVMPVVGCKAAINYYLFKRASGDVVISNDGNFLFYKETIVPVGKHSSYSFISFDSVKPLVNNLNAVYDHFRAMGFNDVYLSIIPNAATILQPEGYNNLVPMIQNDPALKMKIINVYAAFKTGEDVDYLQGDTHWNNNGFNKWLSIVNKMLLSQNTTLYGVKNP